MIQCNLLDCAKEMDLFIKPTKVQTTAPYSCVFPNLGPTQRQYSTYPTQEL